MNTLLVQKGIYAPEEIRVPVPPVCTEKPGLAAALGRFVVDVLPVRHVTLGRVAALVRPDLANGAITLSP